MTTQADILAEAARRGIVPPEKSALLAEAQRRGLVPVESQPEDMNRARMETATRGATLGAADMIVPTVAAMYAKMFGGDAVKDLSPDELFNMADEMVTARRKQYKEAAPIESAVVEIGASLPTGAGVFGGAKALGLGARGGLAATGAVEGFGLAEGDLQEKATQAALGAVMAPATAMALSKVGPNTAKAIRRFAETSSEYGHKALASVFKVNPVAARDFMREGIPISAANISENPTISRLGSILKGTFGSTNIIEKHTDDTLDSLVKRINKKAFSTGRQVTSQEAGLAVQRGVENYIDKFQRVSGNLYGRVARYIPEDTTSALSNTKNMLQTELSTAVDAPNLQAKIAKNKALLEAANAIEDAGDAGLRYVNLRRYRTEVGSLIKQNIISGEDNALAKRVYSALTQDMQDMAKTKGPEALKAFNNANAFYQRGMEQIEKRLSKYIGSSADPSRILAQVQTSAKSGDFKLRAIMKAVSPQDRPVIRDAVLQKVGINSQGDFSTALFFRDYNKISPEAKNVLFGNTDKAFRQSLDRLANISKRMTESGRFTNTSRSADNLGNIGLLALGAFDPVSAITAGGSANMGARLLTNRDFAKIMAKYATRPITQNGFVRMTKELENLAINNLHLESDIMAYIGLLGANAAQLRGEL